MIMTAHGLLCSNYHTQNCPSCGDYDTADLLDWFVTNRKAWDRGKAVWKIDWTDEMQLLCMKKHVCENKRELSPNAEFLFVKYPCSVRRVCKSN